MNFLLALPFEVRAIGLFFVGTAVGAAVNVLADSLRFEPRRFSPWRRAAPPPIAAPPAKRKGGAASKRPAVAPRDFWDKLPVLGWFFLRREEALPDRPPGFWIRPLLVELLLGLLFAWLYWWEVDAKRLVPFTSPPVHLIDLARVSPAALHWQYLAHVLLISFMAAATLIDLDDWIIPDAITLPCTLLGLVLAAAVPCSLLPVADFPAGLEQRASGELGFLTVASPHPWPDPLAAGRWESLAIALGCVWFWALAMTTRIWRGGRGLRIALLILARHFRRQRATRWMLLLGAAASAAVFLVWRSGGAAWIGLFSALAGLVLAGGIVWMVRICGWVVLRREAMGFGDVTLMFMIGAFLGWQTCLMLFFISPFFGLLPPLLSLLFRRRMDVAMPYGPFLCMAALTLIILWAPFWEWAADPALGVLAVWWLVPLLLAALPPLLLALLLALQAVKRLF